MLEVLEISYDKNGDIYNKLCSHILDIDEDSAQKDVEFLKNKNRAFSIIWDLLHCLKEFTVVIEDRYVDRVYRDSYYYYYSSKYFTQNRFCKRVSFFWGKLSFCFADMDSKELQKIFIGSIVIRPINNQSIARTLLNPAFFMQNQKCYLRLATYKITIGGNELEVKAFPYSMQDGETTSCAEITIINISDYYSKMYPEYRYILPSEVCRLAELDSYERRMPTIGLRYELLSKIFTEIGFYPRLYSSRKMNRNKFQHILHYYIESGIPVAIGLKINEQNKHSVVGIGHGQIHYENVMNTLNAVYDSDSQNTIWISDTADLVNEYCLMDDNLRPYYIASCEINNKHKTMLLNGYEAEYLMVPLYKRMFLEAADAYDICTSILANDSLGIHRTGREIGKKENPIIIRMFMASSKTFTRFRHQSFMKDNRAMRDLYDATEFPKFIWVCELYETSSYHKSAIGEIIIDATSSKDTKVDGFIIIHYYDCICRREPEFFLKKKKKTEFKKVRSWKPFPPFSGNLNYFE